MQIRMYEEIRADLEKLKSAQIRDPEREVNSDFDRLSETEPDETVKRFYTLFLQYTRDAEFSRSEAMNTDDAHTKRRCIAQARRSYHKAQLTLHLLYAHLRDTNLPLWEEASVGLRKGWRIVTADPIAVELLQETRSLNTLLR